MTSFTLRGAHSLRSVRDMAESLAMIILKIFRWRRIFLKTLMQARVFLLLSGVIFSHGAGVFCSQAAD
jgi:hypothetical protein